MIHLMNFLSNKMKSLTPNKRQGKSIEKRRQIGINTKTMNKSKAIHWRATRQSHQNGVSRKRKLLEKQKRGKKRMKQIGNVEIPQEAFLAILKVDEK